MVTLPPLVGGRQKQQESLVAPFFFEPSSLTASAVYSNEVVVKKDVLQSLSLEGVRAAPRVKRNSDLADFRIEISLQPGEGVSATSVHFNILLLGVLTG